MGYDRGLNREICDRKYSAALTKALLCTTILSAKLQYPKVKKMAPSVLGVSFIGQATFATGSELVNGTLVGGLSGITYDAVNNRYYSISDDRSQINPARFYTLNIDLSSGTLSNANVTFPNVTTILRPDGTPFPTNSLDPEGIALTSAGTVYISSEGEVNLGVGRVTDPFVNEFSLATGKQVSALPVRSKFSPVVQDTNGNTIVDAGDTQTGGVRNNLAFESLTISPDKGYLFTATENALFQDGNVSTTANGSPSRIVKYNLVTGQPEQEFLYNVEPVTFPPNPPGGFNTNGLVDLLALDSKGKFLALERSFSAGGNPLPTSNTIKLYEVDLSNATDISGIQSLTANGLAGIAPAQKTLILDFNTLGLATGLDNVEGLAFGPKLPNGKQSLVLVSDDNFNVTQFTQILAFSVDLASSTPSPTSSITVPSGGGNLLLGGNTNDVIVGSSSNDTVYGYAGDDGLYGIQGNDYIDGGLGNDTLSGSNGNDTLVGGAGNDSMIGGSGIDNLIGGAGSDTLSYDFASEGADSIVGFASGFDKFFVSDFGFAGGLTAGTLLASQFTSGAGVTVASNPSQRFIYDTSSGILRYDPDGSSATLSSSIIATLSGAPTLISSDIVVF